MGVAVQCLDSLNYNHGRLFRYLSAQQPDTP